jgi:hypothetical protein
MSLRENIAAKIVSVLQAVANPQVILVTREPLEADKLAITQFPAILVQMELEERETITMGEVALGRRAGTISYQINGYVRGTDLDTKRTELITAIENALDKDRYLGLKVNGVTDSQVTRIEVIRRLQPLAEFALTFQVRYNYVRGSK